MSALVLAIPPNSPGRCAFKAQPGREHKQRGAGVSEGDVKYREIELTKGYVAIVDAHRFAELNQFSWRVLESVDGQRYAMRNTLKHEGPRGGCIYMHRQILGVAKGVQVDHIDDWGLHNWEANLRLATNQSNQWNRKKDRDGASRFKGVSRYKHYDRWVAQIRIVPGKHGYLGLFATEEAAANAYDAVARAHFGARARVNFPRPGEQSAIA